MSARGSRLLRAMTVLAVVSSAALVTSCGPGESPRAARRELAPQWQDVFDGTPEIYAVVRPQTIKRDAIYGTFFKNVLRVAQAKTPMRGATALEALEGCDEIIVGIRKDGSGEDSAIVFRGVPASLDPQKMTDAAGHPVLRLVDARAKVPEYQWIDRQSTSEGSLFILPDRTWVGALGAARARARQAFASPFGRPIPKTDPEALAAVRVDATTLLQGPRFANSPMLGPLTRKLNAVTLVLKPGKGGVVATLQYADDDACAWAEMHARRLLGELGKQEPSATGQPRRGGPSLEWLKTAQIGREGNAVTLNLAIPARLLEDLPNASGGDLAL